jgi:hypothetical protein
MPRLARDLWSLVQGRPQIDPDDLAAAIEEQVRTDDLDYRSRWLIRDGANALQAYWGNTRYQGWLAGSAQRESILAVCRESFERVGFPTIKARLMEKTDPEEIRRFLRKLGTQLRQPARLFVGGSAALILQGYLSRHTEDIHVVDELPVEVRSEHRLLDELKADFGLYLAHFQSHYLPPGWEKRVHSLEPFGRVQINLVDVYDLFLSKLFSGRRKDQNDLRVLAPQLDREVLVRRLRETTTAWQAMPDLVKHAKENWFVVFGESFPQ